MKKGANFSPFFLSFAPPGRARRWHSKLKAARKPFLNGLGRAIFMDGLWLLVALTLGARAASPLYPPMQTPFVPWFRDGRPLATIVSTPPAFSGGAKSPATILNEWLERIAGATLPLVESPPKKPRAGPLVWIGGPAAWNRLGCRPGEMDLGPEGYVLRTVGEDLVITGETELGTVFGVTAFVEHALSCRWFWTGPTGLAYPEDANLRVGQIDEVSRPAFRIRWIGSHPDWGAFNRLNVKLNRPGEFRIQWFVHSWLRLVPPSQYWPTNPEYYAQVGGVRQNPTAPRAQVNLCTSNPGTVAAAAKTIDEALRRDPGIRMISVDPMDTQQFCQCSACRTLYDARAPYERRASRLVFDFTRRLAEQVGKTHPNLLLKTIAYHTYLAPPETPDFRVPDTVMIQFCRFMCHNHALDDPACPENRYFNRHLLEWTHVARNIMMYEYYYKVSWCGLPWPIVHTLRRDIPYLHRLGVSGLATQWCANDAANGLDFYVAAKLLWDPSLDVDALLEDFYTKAYGRAAAPMKRFHQRLENAAMASGLHLANQRPYRQMLALFSGNLLEALNSDLTEAENLVRNPRAAARIRLMRTNWAYCNQLRPYLAAIQSVLRTSPHSRWFAALPKDVKTQVNQAAAPSLERLKAILTNPDNQRAVPHHDGYMEILLSPERVADNWNYPGERPDHGVVLDKISWLASHPKASPPNAAGTTVALWIYGNDLDWIKGTGPEHTVTMQIAGRKPRRIAKIGRPDRAGDGRNLCFIVPHVPLEPKKGSAVRFVIDNPPGGPYASKIFALYLMPDAPRDEDEAGKLIETRPEVVRAQALAFAEFGYMGSPANEGSPTDVLLKIPNKK